MGRNKNDEFTLIGSDNSNSNMLRLTTGLVPNGVANVTISNVAPAGVGTATISAWLAIEVNGTIYYIPCWT